MVHLLSVSVFNFVFLTVSCLEYKPKDIFKLCKRNDPDLSKCTYNATVQKIKNFIAGIPEINMTPTDPFLIDKIEKQTKDLVFTLTNVNLTGGRYIKIYDSFQVESDFSWLNYTSFSQQLNLESDYTLERPGKPTKHGKAVFTLDNVGMNVSIGFEFYDKDGEEYMRCNNFIFAIIPSSSTTYLSGITDGKSDESLESIFGNPDYFFGIMLSEELGNNFKNWVNAAVSRHPTKDWFLE